MINKVILVGNVGQQPDIRDTNGGRVANFSLATSEKWKDRNTGERRERTEWHRVTVWGDVLVGVIEQHVNKGDRLFIEGRLQTRKYEKDGQERSVTEVVVRGMGGTLQLLGSRPGAQDQGGGRNASDVVKQGYDQPMDDEIQF